jgi:hypothetical protein
MSHVAHPRFGIVSNMLLQYYPRPFMKHLFGEVLYTEEVAERNCQILNDSCSSTFEDNCYEEISACVDEMRALPGVASDGAIDGKVMSCRTLHGSFAVDNNDHCPHMSFAPQYDVACNVKCQESKSTSDDEVFLQEELAYFAAFSQAIGLGLDQYKTPSIWLGG